MTEVVLYHHVQGLTEGVQSFADELRQAGHTVHTPDLFDGRTFGAIEEGMAFARESWLRRAGRARRGRRRGDPPRRRLRRLLLRGRRRPAACTDAARRPRRLAHVLVPPGLRVRRRVARGRPGAGARQGGRPVLRRGPRGRAGARRLDRPGRAVPLPRESDTSSPTPRSRSTTLVPRHCSPSECWRCSAGWTG